MPLLPQPHLSNIVKQLHAGTRTDESFRDLASRMATIKGGADAPEDVWEAAQEIDTESLNNLRDLDESNHVLVGGDRL